MQPRGSARRRRRSLRVDGAREVSDGDLGSVGRGARREDAGREDARTDDAGRPRGSRSRDGRAPSPPPFRYRSRYFMNLSVRLRYAPRCGVEDAMVVQPRSPPAWFPQHYWAPWNREPPLSPRARSPTLASGRSVSARRERPCAVVSGDGRSSAADGGPSGREAPPESFFRQPGCFSRRDFIGHLRTRTSRRRHGDRTVRSPRTLSARREGPALNGAHIAVSEAHLEPLRAECDPSTPHTRRASLARGPLRLGKSSLCRRQTATAQNRPRLQEARARWQTTTPTPSRPG